MVFWATRSHRDRFARVGTTEILDERRKGGSGMIDQRRNDPRDRKETIISGGGPISPCMAVFVLRRCRRLLRFAAVGFQRS